MKENKVRKIILWVLFIVIALGVIVRISITAVDTKSKISKQISVARGLLEEAEVGNDNGQYSKYRVHLLKTGIEDAQAVLSNRKSSGEEEEKALENIKSDIEDFKNGENKSSLSKEDVQKLIDNEETFERTQDLTDQIQMTMKFETSDIKEAQPINPEALTDGIHMETLMSKVSAEEEGQDFCPIFLAQNDSFPCDVEISISGLDEKEYQVYFYDETEDTVKEITIQENDSKSVTFLVNAGGDYLLVPKDTKDTGQKKEAQEVDESEETDEKETEDETEEETEETNEIEEDDDPEILDEYVQDNTPSDGSSNNQSENQGSADNSNPVDNSQETENVRTSFIEIRCDTILDNMDDLREGLEAYVPSNGVILWASEVELTDGETVFDVLKSVTRETGIKLEFRNDAVHGSGYIVGIGNINELDCGSGSGWMYTVNGWFPNYGCKKYVVEDGDVIQWIYTCDLGRDIGGNFWETD